MNEMREIDKIENKIESLRRGVNFGKYDIPDTIGKSEEPEVLRGVRQKLRRFRKLI